VQPTFTRRATLHSAITLTLPLAESARAASIEGTGSWTSPTRSRQSRSSPRRGLDVVKDLVEVRRHHKMVVVPGAFSFTSNLCVCHALVREPTDARNVLE